MGRKPNLSNWIQFFEGYSNRYTSIYITLLTVGIALILATIPIISILLTIPSIDLEENVARIIYNSMTYLFYILAIGGSLLIFIGVFFSHLNKKPEKYLIKIMKGEITVPDLEKEWFKKGGLILEKEKYSAWKMRIFWMTLTLFILDVVTLSIGIYFNSSAMFGLFEFLITVTLAFLALYFAFHSITIAYDSDDKINNIANVNFLSVLSSFEDRKLDLILTKQVGEIKYVNVTIWKAFVDVNEMKELLEFCKIKEEHQGRMINLYVQFLKIITEAVFTHENTTFNLKQIVSCEAVKHLLQMCKNILEIKSMSEAKREEIINAIKNLFNEPKETIVDDNYIESAIAILKNIIENREGETNFINRSEELKSRIRQLNEQKKVL